MLAALVGPAAASAALSPFADFAFDKEHAAFARGGCHYGDFWMSSTCRMQRASETGPHTNGLLVRVERRVIRSFHALFA
jgi:hypothetical protein